jgi:hypothetical protein
MRRIEGILPDELKSHVNDNPVDIAVPYPVSTYRKLVEQIAKLSFLNKDQLLFYRGQGLDHQNKAGASTQYPSIYRGEYLSSWEIMYRFDILEAASGWLKKLFAREQVEGFRELSRKRYVQWSILQHYEVCHTPLLDLTHSLRVACSFAQLFTETAEAYVYVLGMPYLTNRISINSEHDLVNIRLLSICPPDALRPYFQEGYLAGTTDISYVYENKTELDFRNRLIAKFTIPRSQRFWGEGFDSIPWRVLFPRGDQVGKLCHEIQVLVRNFEGNDSITEFVREWASLEEILLNRAERGSNLSLQTIEAIDTLAQEGEIDEKRQNELHKLRRFRNRMIREFNTFDYDLAGYQERVREAKLSLMIEP